MPNTQATAVLELATAPRQHRKPAAGRPKPLRADTGDTCDEDDPLHIGSRRDTAQAALRRQQAAGRVSDRVVSALLRSPLTLQLVDLPEQVTNVDQSNLLLRLADVLETESATPSVALAGLVALQAMHGVLEDCASTYPVCAGMAEVACRHLCPVGASATWSAVVNSPAP